MKSKQLCEERTSGGVNPNPCWRLAGHHGKHVNQRYALPEDRQLAVVAEDGVLVASYQGFQLTTASEYVRHSGGHVIDVKAWRVLA